MRFKPFGDLADQAFLNLIRTQLTIKTHIAQLKMMKQQAEYPIENDSEDTETRKTSTISLKV